MKKGFSIVICTYDPDLVIFERLLNALDSLRMPNILPVEFIFIDNNSKLPIVKIPFLKAFLAKGPFRRVVNEANPGLTEARIKGFNEAAYDWIVFFDDDNEPNVNYLIDLEKTINKYPEVGCWGPAEIRVELLNVEENAWIQQHKLYFQERNWGKTTFGVSHIWQDYFPYGTGLVVRRTVLMEYVRRIKTGQYSLSDRKGKRLSSGGDLQIVLTATDMQLPAGTIKELTINHLISAKKATISYLEKQIYGTSSSYVAAHKQVKTSIEMDDSTASNMVILKHLFGFLRRHMFKTEHKKLRLHLAEFFGSYNARFIHLKVARKPLSIRLYERFINA